MALLCNNTFEFQSLSADYTVSPPQPYTHLPWDPNDMSFLALPYFIKQTFSSDAGDHGDMVIFCVFHVLCLFFGAFQNCKKMGNKIIGTVHGRLKYVELKFTVNKLESRCTM